MLTNLEIKSLTPKSKTYKKSDGNGLFITVTPSSSKRWLFRYSFAGKEKSLALGAYPEVSVVDAREKCREARMLLRDNIDPSLKRQSEKRQIAERHDHSFKRVATLWYEANAPKWKPKHAMRNWRRLEIHLIPLIGKLPVTEIKPTDILGALKEIEAKGSVETTHRVLWLCNKVFRYAVIIGIATHNPAVNISEALCPNKGGNYPVIPTEYLPQFLTKFRNTETSEQNKLAFQFLMLTALRSHEMRYLKWTSLDQAAGLVRVGKELMKMDEDHLVPLSRQAMNILNQLNQLSGHQEWLFPNSSARVHPVMSENTINKIISNMGYKGKMVGHSFRKLFSTVLNEQEFPEDAIERQLAHRARGGKVRGIYNHAKYLTTRRFLMQWWADYLDFCSFEVVASDSLLVQYPVRTDEFQQPPTQPGLYLSGVVSDKFLLPSLDTRCSDLPG